MASNSSEARGDDVHRLLFEPNTRINSAIDDKLLGDVLAQINAVRSSGEDLILELNTIGGDADVARRIALEVRLFAAHSGRTASCVGKTFVSSAGVTILAAFQKPRRFLTPDTVLLIHERRLDHQQLELAGPITSCIQIVQEALSMLEAGQRLEEEGFADLVEGSRLIVEELRHCIRSNCYMTAHQCLEHGLVSDILR